MTNRRFWYIIGAVTVTAILFHLFFQYDYIHLSGDQVMRVDRLMGESCYMPCGAQAAAPAEATNNEATISFGAGDSNFVAGCEYETYEYSDSDYGIFQAIKGDLPTEGSTVEGDLTGFGRHIIHDASSNEDLTVNVIFHADSYEATLKRMTQLGCLQ